jgi:hypothetical protein
MMRPDAALDETISRVDEAGLKHTPDMVDRDPTTGCDHVGHHYQLILPPLLPVEFD